MMSRHEQHSQMCRKICKHTFHTVDCCPHSSHTRCPFEVILPPLLTGSRRVRRWFCVTGGFSVCTGLEWDCQSPVQSKAQIDPLLFCSLQKFTCALVFFTSPTPPSLIILPLSSFRCLSATSPPLVSFRNSLPFPHKTPDLHVITMVKEV